MKLFFNFSLISVLFLLSLPLLAKQEPCPCKDATIIYENGGGLISPSAFVHSGSVYIGKDAKVCGTATVLHNVKILNHARVCENASISHDAVIGGHARVFGNASAHHSAKILGRTWLFDQATVGQNSTSKDNVMVFGKGEISGNSIVTGDAIIRGRVLNLNVNYNILPGYDACLFSPSCPEGQYKTE